MKITLAELCIVLDTLKGSCGLIDRTDLHIFSYKADQRLRLFDSLMDRLNNVTISLEIEEENKFAEQASKVFTKIPILDGILWMENSPKANAATWNNHNIYFKGEKIELPGGLTDFRYIYWCYGVNGYIRRDDLVDHKNWFLIAINNGGKIEEKWNSV